MATFYFADYPNIKSRQEIALKHGFAVFVGNPAETTPIYNLTGTKRSNSKMVNNDALLKYMEKVITAEGRKPTAKEYEIANEILNGVPESLFPAFWDQSTKRTYFADPQDGMGGYSSHPNRGEFKSMDEEMRALVLEGKHDSRVARIQAQQVISEPSSGGFFTSTQTAADILGATIEMSPLLRTAKRYMMTEARLKVCGADDRDHSGDIAGLQGVWLAEAGTMSPDKIVHRAIELEPNKLGILTRGSREYFADAKSAESFVRDTMIKASNFYLDRALIRGSGVGQPLGLLNCPNLITQAAEAGQEAQSFT